MTWQLGGLRSPEARLQGAWVILPVGSCEVHGPHLPLDLDVRIAEGMAQRAAKRLEHHGIRTLVLPPLPYGVTRFGRNFDGTLSIPAEVVAGFVTEVLCSAVLSGAAGVGIANGHLEPAHVEALFAACARVRERAGMPVAFPHVGSRRHAERLAARVTALDGHAGRYETSLALALAPELVGDHGALPEVGASLAAGIVAGASSFEEAGGPDAYFGAPARASAEEGNALLDELGAMLAEAVLAIRPASGR